MTIARNLLGKGLPIDLVRTIEAMDARLTKFEFMLTDLTRKIATGAGNGGLTPQQQSDVAGLIGALSQSVIGQGVNDPVLPGQVGTGGTVTSITVAAGTNLTGGGTITTTGTVTLNLNANISVTTVDAVTSYKVGGTKVIGAQGGAVADAAGGATIDVEARAAINAWLARARASTGHGLIAG